MWIKLDDGFATHPKILRAGPFATVLQVRALCYASQNKTDGFIPVEVVPMLTVGLTVTSEEMCHANLWEVCERGYQIHDYLQWNMSREEYHSMKLKLSKAGKKGMKSRWKRYNQGYKVGNKVSDNLPDNPAITGQSTSIDTLNPLSPPNPKSESQTKKKSNGLHEWPEDFVLSEEMKSRAVALDLNPFVEFAKFKDHHLAKGSKMKDWNAAWRTWIRNGVEFKEARR